MRAGCQENSNKSVLENDETKKKLVDEQARVSRRDEDIFSWSSRTVRLKRCFPKCASGE